MFRYISGDLKEFRQKGWPEYRLSLRTADAGREAQGLAQRLRKTALKDLVDTYHAQYHTLLGITEIRRLTEIAVGLRDAFLFETRDERDAAQWIEIENGQLDYAIYAKSGNWDAAVSLWEDLDRHYPRQTVIQSNLIEARIRQALLHADISLKEGKSQDALNVLWNVQRDLTLSRSGELNLKLAEVYVAREEFTKVYEILRMVETSDTAYAEKALQNKAKYENEEKVLGYLHRADDERKKGRYHRALEILLSDAPKNERIKDDKRLTDLATSIYTQQTEELNETIDTQNKIGTYPAKVNALNTALNLRELEKLYGIEETHSRALQVINDLGSELPKIANNLVQTINGYNLEGMHLMNALEYIRDAVQRLEAFESIKEQFKNELDEQLEPLSIALQRARTRLSNLIMLNEQIEKTKSPTLWEKALIQRSFTTLGAIKSEIDQLKLPNLLEVDAFTEKLNEYQALSKHFENALQEIQENFILNEDFPAVIRQVNRLKSRPAKYRLENEREERLFKQVLQNDYDLAYELVGNNFQLPDLFSDNSTNLNGWQTILQTAERREADYLAWNAWADIMREQEEKGKKCYGELEQKLNIPSMTLIGKIKEWAGLLSVLDTGLEANVRLPHNSEIPLPIQSEKADKAKKAGVVSAETLRKQKIWVETQIREIESTIVQMGGFPTTNELK